MLVPALTIDGNVIFHDNNGRPVTVAFNPNEIKAAYQVLSQPQLPLGWYYIHASIAHRLCPKTTIANLIAAARDLQTSVGRDIYYLGTKPPIISTTSTALPIGHPTLPPADIYYLHEHGVIKKQGTEDPCRMSNSFVIVHIPA